MELTTALGLSMAVLLVIILSIIFLNQNNASAGNKLVSLMKPYELAFETFKKRTYASGFVGKVWTVFYVQPKGDGDQARLRMRTRIDLPSAPRFYLASVKTRRWLMNNQHRMAKDWPRVDERFYVQVLDRDVNDIQLVQALSVETLARIDAFEEQFDGLMVYSIDTNLFEKADAELLQLYPELRHELVLFTHIEASKELTQEQFGQFIQASIAISTSIEADLRKLFHMGETQPHDSSRKLRIKRFQA